jgi:hypothetical protein
MDQKAIPQTNNNSQKPAATGAVMPQSESASALTAGLAHEAHAISNEVKHVAGEVAGEVKKAAETKLGAGKDFAVEHLESVASALRHTSQQLGTQDSPITSYVSKAASSVDSVSNYLQTRTLSQLIGDAEGFARREPAIFLGGAFFAGLLGGRFLKSATPKPEPRNPMGPGMVSGNHTPPQLSHGTTSPKTETGTSSASMSSASRPASGKDRGVS